jgi:hypothetical protein
MCTIVRQAGFWMSVSCMRPAIHHQRSSMKAPATRWTAMAGPQLHAEAVMPQKYLPQLHDVLIHISMK